MPKLSQAMVSPENINEELLYIISRHLNPESDQEEKA